MQTPRLVAGVFSFAVAGAPLFQALVETDGGAGEIEFGAQLVFEEALVTEVERLQLVGEKDEGGRGGGGLGDVENFYFAAGGRGAAVEVYFLEPAVQLAGGNAAVSGFDYAIDHGVESVDMLAGFRGEENYRSVREKF